MDRIRQPENGKIGRMDRVLCQTLVGREEQLFRLEDALLAAHRRESRFVALGGEAGMGKTRLATELAKRAHRLGWEVLSGACSEAELPLPYLPLVEAIGNYLAVNDVELVAGSLGAARRELAQLFPQLADDAGGAPVGDPAQAKLRLFEAVVALVAVIARERGVLLIVEDIHWADAATRELLDHLARRLAGLRSMVLVTYRSDELDRRHPLAPVLQAWRRSRVAEVVTLSPLDEDELAEMIADIFDDAVVGRDFRHLMHERTEGNPFVIEEMLREAIDRGDIFRAEGSWQRRALEELRIPETVRDTILLRFARLDPGDAHVLEAAAVLGRTFEYATLSAVAGGDDAVVRQALAVGVAQQLLDEFDRSTAAYRWRHALTQEAVADEVVMPRRQEIDSRAADAARAAGAPPLRLARHLLGAGRFDDAVPVCIEAAKDAEATLAFTEAAQLLERALPHAHDPLLRARLLCRMGRVLWMDGRTAAAQEVLVEGVAALEDCGEELEAAPFRVMVGRCRWEQGRSAEALEDVENALRVLAEHGPSAELAMAYFRLAGLYKFEFDERSLETAVKAMEVAEAAGADFERVWATSWVGFTLVDEGRTAEGARMIDEAFDEARRRGFSFIAHNIAYNDAWTRLHTMAPGISDRLTALAAEPGPPVITDMIAIATSWALRVRGELQEARRTIERAESATPPTANLKTRWRTNVELAEVLLELGRLEEASAVLPPPSERVELQDIVYDSGPQIRLRLATGRLEEAVALGREIAGNARRLAAYPDAIVHATEALVAAGLADEAQSMVDTAREAATVKESPLFDDAQGRILLAQGDSAGAARMLGSFVREAGARGYLLAAWRVRAVAAAASAATGDRAIAERELAAVAGDTAAAGAMLILHDVHRIAQRAGITLPAVEAPSTTEDGEPELVGAGERLVTAMFADVRGYTELATSAPPAELVDRLGALHRWAAAEVGRHDGLIDKFAGDAVMATFNATGARIDHTAQALEAAMALTGKAALLDLGVGVGIAVGPAVVGRTVAGGNVSVLGEATNLAARLQTSAAAGEILLSDEAHRRVARWLSERGLQAGHEMLELKGFAAPQPAWRLRTSFGGGDASTPGPTA
jgi:class 3 adenylate cyclase